MFRLTLTFTAVAGICVIGIPFFIVTSLSGAGKGAGPLGGAAVLYGTGVTAILLVHVVAALAVTAINATRPAGSLTVAACAWATGTIFICLRVYSLRLGSAAGGDLANLIFWLGCGLVVVGWIVLFVSVFLPLRPVPHEYDSRRPEDAA